jgi:hypothetical protein
MVRAGAEVTPAITRYSAELEPLVRKLEDTPRDACAALVAEGLRNGITYRQWMAALFLAGIRNVNPQPPGFALHCVFVVHSAHLLGMEAPAGSKELPLFYALDTFKASQDRDSKQTSGDWTMRELGRLPNATQAGFRKAMETWNIGEAERAAASLATQGEAREVFESLWRFGARDYRNIGHKAIYVANAERTLDTIGWEHAVPVIRSLVLALLDFGPERQVNGYGFADQCFLANERRVADMRLPGGWASGTASKEGALRVLHTIRSATPEQACAAAGEQLTKGAANAASVWDGVHLAAVEIMMRAKGSIVGLHAVSAANGLHHAWLKAAEPKVRLLVLLQGVGWMTQFRTFAGAREGALSGLAVDTMQGRQGGMEAVWAARKERPEQAAECVLEIAATPEGRRKWLSEAMRHTSALADEVHLYKYLAAIVEDSRLVSEAWRPHLAASLAFYMKGPGDAEPLPMKRARQALA